MYSCMYVCIIAGTIVRIIMADKWYVCMYSCMYVCSLLSSRSCIYALYMICMYLSQAVYFDSYFVLQGLVQVCQEAGFLVIQVSQRQSELQKTMSSAICSRVQQQFCRGALDVVAKAECREGVREVSYSFKLLNKFTVTATMFQCKNSMSCLSWGQRQCVVVIIHAHAHDIVICTTSELVGVLCDWRNKPSVTVTVNLVWMNKDCATATVTVTVTVTDNLFGSVKLTTAPPPTLSKSTMADLDHLALHHKLRSPTTCEASNLWISE